MNDLPAQLHRRHDARLRSFPLPCGCRDPLVHHCTELTLTEAGLDGWVAAAEYLIDHGLMPSVPLAAMRAMWRRPADRRLAELLHEAGGGAVA